MRVRWIRARRPGCRLSSVSDAQLAEVAAALNGPGLAHARVVIHGYADASFADIPDTRLSSIRYVFLLNGGAISWRSTKTPLHVLNAAEAEIVSLSSAAQDCFSLRELCIDMGFHQHRPTIIYEDCKAAVALSKVTRFRKRSKHIALNWHFIVERQSTLVCDLKVFHRRRTKKLADIFASPRAAPTFIAFRDHILGHKSAFLADDDE